MKLDNFTRSYIECALWSSTGDDGEPLDATFYESDLSGETLARMAEDCAMFQADNATDLSECGADAARAGFLFWLNRNGHGTGFWDQVGGDHSLRAVFNRLSDASEAWGSFYLYIGDDKHIHGN
jgi:hypothetical protein